MERNWGVLLRLATFKLILPLIITEMMRLTFPWSWWMCFLPCWKHSIFLFFLLMLSKSVEKHSLIPLIRAFSITSSRPIKSQESIRFKASTEKTACTGEMWGGAPAHQSGFAPPKLPFPQSMRRAPESINGATSSRAHLPSICFLPCLATSSPCAPSSPPFPLPALKKRSHL